MNGAATSGGRHGGAPEMPADEGLLEHALRILRNRKWVVIQAVVIVPLLALLLSLIQTERYTGSASLLFRDPQALLDTQTSSGLVDPARQAATNQELVSLPVVAARTAAAVGGITPKQVEDTVSVKSTGEGDVVEIRADADTPRRAAQLANAYGQAYIDFRRDADAAQVDNAINAVRQSLAALPPSARSGANGQQLQQRLQQLQLARSTQTGDAELVQRATPPETPSSPNLKRNVLIGLLLGATLGFGLAALLDRLDRRLKEPSEVEELFDLPILAQIPRSARLSGASRDVGADTSLPAEETEYFRTLRANLRYFGVDEPVRSVLVASPLAGEGKSTVARMLATTMASMGDSVVLVEADLHKPPPNGRRPQLGLSSLLAGASLDECLMRVPVPRQGDGEKTRELVVLPAGPPPPNPSELLESTRMSSVLEVLEARFDLVILDTPALSLISDALALVPSVSGVIVVCGLGETTRDAAIDFRKQVALLGGRVLGLVANFAKARNAGDYYYGQATAPSGR